MTKPVSTGLARALLLVTVVTWGWTFVATKILLGFVDPVELLGLRMLVGVPVLLVLVRAMRIDARFPRAELPRLALAGGLVLLHFLVQITGLRSTTATNTGWIIAVIPLALAVLSYAVLGERIGRHGVIGIVVATAGIALLMSGGDVLRLGWLRNTGDWLVLGSAFTWAAFTVASRDVARRRSPMAVTLAVLLPSTVVGLVYMGIATDWPAVARLPLRAWIALFFLGVFGTALSHWFWQLGVARLGAAKAGFFLYIEPLATTALAVPLLGEPFGGAGIAGAALVVAGVWWAERKKGAPASA